MSENSEQETKASPEWKAADFTADIAQLSRIFEHVVCAQLRVLDLPETESVKLVVAAALLELASSFLGGAHAANGAAEAFESNLKTFLATFESQARHNQARHAEQRRANAALRDALKDAIEKAKAPEPS